MMPLLVGEDIVIFGDTDRLCPQGVWFKDKITT